MGIGSALAERSSPGVPRKAAEGLQVAVLYLVYFIEDLVGCCLRNLRLELLGAMRWTLSTTSLTIIFNFWYFSCDYFLDN